jgi:hypothetical protein
MLGHAGTEALARANDNAAEIDCGFGVCEFCCNLSTPGPKFYDAKCKGIRAWSLAPAYQAVKIPVAQKVKSKGAEAQSMDPRTKDSPCSA